MAKGVTRLPPGFVLDDDDIGDASIDISGHGNQYLSQAELFRQTQPDFESKRQAVLQKQKAELDQKMAVQEQQAKQLKAQEAFNADPKNWASERFKKEAPKPKTTQEQLIYNQTLKQKQEQEHQASLKGQDFSQWSSSEFERNAPEPKTLKEQAIYNQTLEDKKYKEANDIAMQSDFSTWSSERFKKDAPKPRTIEDKAIYDATIKKKQAEELRLSQDHLPKELQEEEPEETTEKPQEEPEGSEELPEGFVLDEPGMGTELPEGFVLDEAEAPKQGIADVISKVAQAGPASLGMQVTDIPAVETAAKVPGAAIRSSILGTGYGYGAMNPDEIPSLRSQFEPTVNSYVEKSLGINTLPEPIKKALIGAIKSTPAIQAVTETVMGLPDMLTDPVQVALNALLGKVGASKHGIAAGKAIEKIGSIGPTLQHLDDRIASEVKHGVIKGIRPSVSGKGTIKKTDQYYDSAVEGVKAIVGRKDSLKFVDEFGETSSRLPKSTADYASAISQTKESIYSEYTNLAKTAGDQGAGFDIESIIRKAAKGIVGNKSYSPAAREYAEKQLKGLAELHGESPLTIQARIEELNSTLGSYYRGATTKVNADIDATLAHAMREKLDDLITSATGEAYKPLKKLYGALKALEKDVNHRAVVFARRAPSGLLDGATDLFTGERLISATVKAFTGNPIGSVGDLAKIAAVKSFNFARNQINSPDKTISKMFKQVDNLMAARGKLAERLTPKAVKKHDPMLIPNVPKPMQKQLTVDPKQGKGFVRLSKEESDKILHNLAFKYWHPTKKQLILPDTKALPRKGRNLLKQMGIDPNTGKAKSEKAKTAFDIAWKRANETHKKAA